MDRPASSPSPGAGYAYEHRKEIPVSAILHALVEDPLIADGALLAHVTDADLVRALQQRGMPGSPVTKLQHESALITALAARDPDGSIGQTEEIQAVRACGNDQPHHLSQLAEERALCGMVRGWPIDDALLCDAIGVTGVRSSIFGHKDCVGRIRAKASELGRRRGVSPEHQLACDLVSAPPSISDTSSSIYSEHHPRIVATTTADRRLAAYTPLGAMALMRHDQHQTPAIASCMAQSIDRADHIRMRQIVAHGESRGELDEWSPSHITAIWKASHQRSDDAAVILSGMSAKRLLHYKDAWESASPATADRPDVYIALWNAISIRGDDGTVPADVMRMHIERSAARLPSGAAGSQERAFMGITCCRYGLINRMPDLGAGNASLVIAINGTVSSPWNKLKAWLGKAEYADAPLCGRDAMGIMTTLLFMASISHMPGVSDPHAPECTTGLSPNDHRRLSDIYSEACASAGMMTPWQDPAILALAESNGIGEHALVNGHLALRFDHAATDPAVARGCALGMPFKQTGGYSRILAHYAKRSSPEKLNGLFSAPIKSGLKGLPSWMSKDMPDDIRIGLMTYALQQLMASESRSEQGRTYHTGDVHAGWSAWVALGQA